jgi:predicted ester cyclase
MGIPPTGKAIEITGTYMNIIRDGLIIEEWGNWDAMGMMVQLGVVPPPPG